MCPICNRAFVYKNYSDEYGVTESFVQCEYCDFIAHDVYGQSVVSFGSYSWHWDHNCTSEELLTIECEMANAIAISKPSFKNRKYRYYQECF